MDGFSNLLHTLWPHHTTRPDDQTTRLSNGCPLVDSLEFFYSMKSIVGRLNIHEIVVSELVLSDSIGGWPRFSFLRKAFWPLLVVYVLCDRC